MTKSDSPAITVVGVHEAKTNLSRLLRMVESGAEVEIRRGGSPIARLLPIDDAPPKRQLGIDKGKIWISDDFDEPMTEIEQAIASNDLFPA
ncbi:type II toxin-antitoxin system Phd/YefM family antitoxin [Microbacterium invictum]|uniref:Antitoxin n=1 Tax=Microbacterium invictum TaxID=515415 RepID=A0AA40SNQ9_9MICO|nr:type II toxin-antitoxin system prevent-host-death family antitoxin [Microbacterium invictum]MBB4139610.1 prevent-host-death family protein [Microbacterium invictum]